MSYQFRWVSLWNCLLSLNDTKVTFGSSSLLDQRFVSHGGRGKVLGHTGSKCGAEDRNSVIPSPLLESLVVRSGMWGIPTPSTPLAEPETDGAQRSCRQADVPHTPTRLACLHGPYVGGNACLCWNGLKCPLNGQLVGVGVSWCRRGICFSQVLLLALVRNTLVTDIYIICIFFYIC